MTNSPKKSTNPMDIEQVKTAKSNLDNEIAELLIKFSANTGLVIDYVNIERWERLDTSTSYVVTTDVRLS